MLVLAAFSACAFAAKDGSKCIAHPEKFADKMKSSGITSVVITSPAKYLDNAKACAKAIKPFGVNATVKEDDSLSELAISKAS